MITWFPHQPQTMEWNKIIRDSSKGSGLEQKNGQTEWSWFASSAHACMCFKAFTFYPCIMVLALTCFFSLPYYNNAIKVWWSQQVLSMVPSYCYNWKTMTLKTRMISCVNSRLAKKLQVSTSSQESRTCSLFTHVCFGRVKS